MNRRNYTLVIITFLILVCFNGKAQDQEYIITFDNDTIYGKVGRKIDYGYARYNFKFKDKKRNRRVIKPDEVSEFHTVDGFEGNAYFESIEQKYFLKRIINGRIKLYLSVGDLNHETVTYYLSKNDSRVTIIDIGKMFSRKKSHEQVRKFIADNDKILKEFDAMKGSEKNIRYIIEKYNKYYMSKVASRVGKGNFTPHLSQNRT